MTDESQESLPFDTRWTKETVLSLINQLRSLRADRKFTYKQLAIDCLVGKDRASDHDAIRRAQERLSRWMNDPNKVNSWRVLGEEEFRRLLAFKIRIENVPSEEHDARKPIPDAMFYGLLSWFESNAETVQDLRTFVGDYTVYRHSFSAPGMVAVGHLVIETDETTRAITVRETHKFNIGDDQAAASFNISGYLGRKRGHYYVFSLHEDGTDVFVQYCFISRVFRRGGPRSKVNGFAGLLSDVQSHHFYSTSFACVAGKPKTIDAIPYEQVPPRVTIEIGGVPSLLRGEKGLGYVFFF